MRTRIGWEKRIGKAHLKSENHGKLWEMNYITIFHWNKKCSSVLVFFNNQIRKRRQTIPLHNFQLWKWVHEKFAKKPWTVTTTQQQCQEKSNRFLFFFCAKCEYAWCSELNWFSCLLDTLFTGCIRFPSNLCLYSPFYALK